jgi:hypothetical protein
MGSSARLTKSGFAFREPSIFLGPCHQLLFAYLLKSLTLMTLLIPKEVRHLMLL